jgi:hypothetical protein
MGELAIAPAKNIVADRRSLGLPAGNIKKYCCKVHRDLPALWSITPHRDIGDQGHVRVVLPSRVAVSPEPSSVIIQDHLFAGSVDILDYVVRHRQRGSSSEILKTPDAERRPRLSDCVSRAVLRTGTEAPPHMNSQKIPIHCKAKLQCAFALGTARAGIERSLACLSSQQRWVEPSHVAQCLLGRGGGGKADQ